MFDRVNYLTGNYRENSGKRAAQILMLSETLPEVLVCANDNMAIGAIKAFRENGLRVPEDIAVTGFDNSSLAEAFGLTTVAIPNYERGWLAAQYLIENIRGMDKYDTFKISAKVILARLLYPAGDGGRFHDGTVLSNAGFGGSARRLCCKSVFFRFSLQF